MRYYIRDKIDAWMDRRNLYVMQNGVKISGEMAKAWTAYVCDDNLPAEVALSKLWASFNQPPELKGLDPLVLASTLSMAASMKYGATVVGDKWTLNPGNPYLLRMIRSANALKPDQVAVEAKERGEKLHGDLYKYKAEKCERAEGVTLGGNPV
jgi:hypothetical protein